jgi:hypothetical protein
VKDVKSAVLEMVERFLFVTLNLVQGLGVGSYYGDAETSSA